MEYAKGGFWDGFPIYHSDELGAVTIPDDCVDPGFECPVCGEARVDYLVMDDDDNATCATCGHVYNPIDSRRIVEAANA